MDWLMIIVILIVTMLGLTNSVFANTPIAFDSEEYQAMITKSILSKGNNKRLKGVIEKAKRGEDVTIAFIGGSITEGAGANPPYTNCYAYQTYLRFKEMFGQGDGEHIHFVKAGVGGTPSQLGVIRYERDVLRDGTVEPDIVIVEFAVNDWDDETKGVSYESLVLKILSAENNPVVILLFCVFESDWNLQDRLAPVGWHYDLPMVSIKDAVVPQFRLTKKQGNVITKEQFFADIYHPTNDGHRITADCLANLFMIIAESAKDKDDIVIDKEPVIGDAFKDIRLLDRKDHVSAVEITPGGFNSKDYDVQKAGVDAEVVSVSQFPNNWMHSSTSGSDSFKMQIKSSSLMLVYKDSWNPQFGKADIYVDGKHIMTADPHIINWTHCHAVLLYQEEESRLHKIEIQMAPGDEEKNFTILGFGYVL